jgi:hypothetical protein
LRTTSGVIAPDVLSASCVRIAASVPGCCAMRRAS